MAATVALETEEIIFFFCKLSLWFCDVLLIEKGSKVIQRVYIPLVQEFFPRMREEKKEGGG